MANTNYRIVIPSVVADYRKLIDNIKKENDRLMKPGTENTAAPSPGKSPLARYTEAINQGAEDMAAAEKLENEANALRRQAEAKIEERNQLWKKITLENERGWRKILEGEYINKIQKMGDWGYEVDTSPRASAPEPPAK